MSVKQLKSFFYKLNNNNYNNEYLYEFEENLTNFYHFTHDHGELNDYNIDFNNKLTDKFIYILYDFYNIKYLFESNNLIYDPKIKPLNIIKLFINLGWKPNHYFIYNLIIFIRIKIGKKFVKWNLSNSHYNNNLSINKNENIIDEFEILNHIKLTIEYLLKEGFSPDGLPLLAFEYNNIELLTICTNYLYYDNFNLNINFNPNCDDNYNNSLSYIIKKYFTFNGHKDKIFEDCKCIINNPNEDELYGGCQHCQYYKNFIINLNDTSNKKVIRLKPLLYLN